MFTISTTSNGISQAKLNIHATRYSPKLKLSLLKYKSHSNLAPIHHLLQTNPHNQPISPTNNKKKEKTEKPPTPTPSVKPVPKSRRPSPLRHWALAQQPSRQSQNSGANITQRHACGVLIRCGDLSLFPLQCQSAVIKLQKYVQSLDLARWTYQYRGQEDPFSAFLRGE